MFAGEVTAVGGGWTHGSRGEWAGTHLPRKGGRGEEFVSSPLFPSCLPITGMPGGEDPEESRHFPSWFLSLPPQELLLGPFLLLGVLLAPISHLSRAGHSC